MEVFGATDAAGAPKISTAAVKFEGCGTGKGKRTGGGEAAFAVNSVKGCRRTRGRTAIQGKTCSTGEGEGELEPHLVILWRFFPLVGLLHGRLGMSSGRC